MTDIINYATKKIQLTLALLYTSKPSGNKQMLKAIDKRQQ